MKKKHKPNMATLIFIAIVIGALATDLLMNDRVAPPPKKVIMDINITFFLTLALPETPPLRVAERASGYTSSLIGYNVIHLN
jgi:hypothetical protein